LKAKGYIMGKARQLIPAARKADLVVEEVPGETLVYDLKSHKAHCLNRTAALVWKHCDGKRTAEQVARKVETELGTPVSAEVVWLAVEQLGRLRLLQEPVERAPGTGRISRREAVRRLGISAAVALPIITSILTPTAVQAASAGPCGAFNAPCGGANPPCCAGLFCGGGGTCTPINP
jgi:hypothetical protein